MFTRLLAAVVVALLSVMPAAGQGIPSAGGAMPGAGVAQPQQYEILGVSVEGVPDQSTKAFVKQTSGLNEGEQVQLQGDEAVAQAVRSIYKLGMFDNVKVSVDRVVDSGVYLTIHVEEVPKLADYTFSGVGGDEDDLQEQLPLIKQSPVRPGDIERAKQSIRSFYEEKGYLNASVDVTREEGPQNTVTLAFDVDRGDKVEVDNISFAGNEVFSDEDLRDAMEKTIEDRWWRFWKSETFDQAEYEEDLQRVIQFYNEKGYYDARVLRDSVYMKANGDDTDMMVEVTVHEGPQYHISDITWEGNTVYSDQVLSRALGLNEGDVFDGTQLQQNLQGNRAGTDVRSLYMDRGYMRFNVQPNISVVGGDSLDIHFEIQEGDVYEFGDITVAGNTKTKEHVIRRELYTIPGQRFSKSAIQESIRRLQQLQYFSQESLSQGPGVSVDEEEKEVNLTYNLNEVSSDQLELSGTYGRIGLILQLSFNFNNFSVQNLLEGKAWDPLPTGDGQKFSVGVRTNGRYYQNYSLSFREPWFRGRPSPVGVSLSYSRYGGAYFGIEDGALTTGSARTFYSRRLRWPDDNFQASMGVQYQYYSTPGDRGYGGLPSGISQEVTFQPSISRNSVDNPRFPTSGSNVNLSLEVAPPVGDFIQYHKWRFDGTWHAPLHEKVALTFGADFGYIGSLTGGDVQFQRFVVGGSPFDTQGRYSFQYFGKDIVYMRGYPAGALGPRLDGQPIGGRVLNKFTSALRWTAIQSPQVSAAPYVFLDAANTWSGLDTYNPAQLYRSAGVGSRIYLPMIGMVELVYGYNFDTFQPVQNESHSGERRWYFQFSLGRGF